MCRQDPAIYRCTHGLEHGLTILDAHVLDLNSQGAEDRHLLQVSSGASS
jgi:hypothetical protein